MAANYTILADGEVLYIANAKDRIVLDPKLSIRENQTDSLTFKVPKTNALYGELYKLSTTIEVRRNDTDILFRGRIVDSTTDFDRTADITCEGALAFLGDTIKERYLEGTYTTPKALFEAALNEHAAQVPSSTPLRKITYFDCDVTTSGAFENKEVSQTSEVLSSLLSDYGGYVQIYYTDSMNYITYYSNPSIVDSQSIRFSENLLDLTITEDGSGVFTTVLPCGKVINDETGERLRLGTGNAAYVENADAVTAFGRIIRPVTFDDVEDTATLRALAEFYLASGVRLATTVTANAIDLSIIDINVDRLHIGNMVMLDTWPHNLSAYMRCSEMNIDLVNPESSTYVFGVTIKGLTDM